MKKFQTKLITIAAIFCLSIVSFVSAKVDTIAIIDAGSSGSRLYVYEVDKANAKTKELHNQKKEPGLSDAAGVANIYLLLQNPNVAYLKSSTTIPLYVLATAGMRMLSEDSAKNIYSRITTQIRRNGYNLDTAMTISGRYEGLYAWIAAGVKNGHLGISGGKFTYHGEPFGIIELGGASMQQTFPLNNTCGTCINRFGTANIYSKSYLGWGIDQVDLSKAKPESKTNKYNSDTPNLRDMKIIWYQLGGGFIKDSLSYQKKYKSWLLDGKNNLQKLQKPKNASDWTEGAAIDIIINGKTPEVFNYSNPN